MLPKKYLKRRPGWFYILSRWTVSVAGNRKKVTRFLLHDINNSSFTKATRHRPRGKNENVEKRENRITRQFDHNNMQV